MTLWGALGHHTKRHRFIVFSDDDDDPLVEVPHSRWPKGSLPFLVRASEVQAARHLPRCKLCSTK